MSINKNLSNLSPLELEDIREKLSKKKNHREFLDLYKKGLPEIINNNTGHLWDNIFYEPEDINHQDAMTREKICYISNYLENTKQAIKLLDIGIGQAFLEQKLTRQNVKFNLSAIDISKLSIHRAKQNYHANGFVDDALNIDKLFKPTSFDVTVAIEVIEHISPSNIFSFYKKVHYLLKDGGLFIVSTPLNEGLRFMKENPSAHVREYTKNILESEFEISKFNIIKAKELYAFKNFYLLKKITARIFPNRWKPNNIIIIAKKA